MVEKLRKISLTSIYRVFLYCMSAVLFFSFWPWINFGMNSTMNFDLSLPLIWLGLFDILAVVMIVKNKLVGRVFRLWPWLLLPVFLTISLLWSHDILRSVLIVGVVWLLYIAVFALVSFKKYIADEEFWRTFLKVFFGAGLIVSAWCVLQCIMDVAGAPRDATLLCAGCTYRTFGFPHPNGFAAEPQFMGNLLLAPIFVSLYLFVKNQFFSRKIMLAFFCIFVMTLFLTLSRGAIYAFGVALVLFTVVWGIKHTWKVLWVWLVIVFAFLCTLGIQGILSEVSPTNDTFVSGVSKVINQLSLGKIDLGGSQEKKDNTEESGAEQANNVDVLPADYSAETEAANEEALFDGYVEVSTTSRLGTWQSAIRTWARNPMTILFGSGVGGELMAMYESGNYDSSREIVNNQYISFLLEGGLVGMALFLLSLVLVFRAVRKATHPLLIFTLIAAYMVSMLFFSGLPNALHIYLLPALFWTFSQKEKSSRRA